MIVALLGGILLPFAFAPFDVWPLAIVSIALLFSTWQHATPRQAFINGWLYGIGSFGLGVSWIYVSIHDFGNLNVYLSSIITIGFIALLALFPAGAGYLLKKFCKRHFILAAPAIWVLFEYLRSSLLTGFPWLLLGTSQLYGPLKFYVPLIGTYGVSWLVALSANCAYLLIINKLHKKLLSGILAGLLAIIYVGAIPLTKIDWVTLLPTTHTVNLVQGNIKPQDKFLLSHPFITTWQVYGKMTEANTDAEFIIWPENSLPVSLEYATDFIQQLDLFGKADDFTLILGLPSINQQRNYHNTLLALGNSQGIYYKQRLVPFGEYVPFQKLLTPIFDVLQIPVSQFTVGPANQQPFNIQNTKMLPLICYEVAFAQQVRNSVSNDAPNVIVNISEDGWFGRSWGPKQHLAIAQMRALENGRYLLRATTCGITAIIDHRGNIVKRAPQFVPYVLKGSFVDIAGNTPWTIIGIWPLLGLLLVSTRIKLS